MSELNVYHHELRPNEYAEFYLKYEADKVIAEKAAIIIELQDKNKRLEEIKDKYSSYAGKAIDNIAKCELKIRSLSRALFKACANWARFGIALFADEHEAEKWRKMESKCLKKAEEYQMSELEAYIGPHLSGYTLTEFYLKSEADKVFAKKDCEISKLKEQVALLQAEFIPKPGV